MFLTRTTRTVMFFVLLTMLRGACPTATQAENWTPPNVSTLKQLYGRMTTNGRVIASFKVQGVVCAVSPIDGMLVLQDDSSSILLELPPLDQAIKTGDTVMLEGIHSTLTRGPFGIQVGTAPVVNIDGSHGSASKSGQVFLNAGLIPLRVEWFNDYDGASLRIEYEGPGVARADIPKSALFHKTENPARTNGAPFDPGLLYTNYTGSYWKILPDFQKLTPLKQGIASGFDISLRARPDQSAMTFTGYLKIAHAGIYTFYTESDDGCKLYVGNPAAHCKISITPNARQNVITSDLLESPSEDGNQRWSKVEGKIHSLRNQPGLSELELDLGERPMTVEVLNDGGLTATNLSGATVRATGIYQRTWNADENWPPRLVVPSEAFLTILTSSNLPENKRSLTSVGQIRALSWKQIRQAVPVHIRGIITMANYMSCVLQDASGGIYVTNNPGNWANQPRPGEIWEFNGVTDAGEFAPIVISSGGRFLGYAALPKGIRPTWSEFQDGSLDADVVDIEAAVVNVSRTTLGLLTRDGTVTLHEDARRPLPRGPDGTPESLRGCVVRLHGVYTTATKGLVSPRQFLLGNVSVSIIEPASTNWFQGPAKPVRDLLQFRSPTANWGRVKVAGVVLHSEPREYIVSDQTSSIRVYTSKSQPVQVGDSVEAAGYPQIGGPSPVLLEAKIQSEGRAALPHPMELDATSLPDQSKDARLVQIKAMVLGDTVQQTERVIDVQAGQNHFLAKLRLHAGAPAMLRPGTVVQLTGIYSSLGSRQTGNRLDGFELLLNQPDDIVVLRPAPWWTPRRILTLAGILAFGLMLALAWAALLRRTVARRTSQLRQETENRRLIEQQRVLEQERSRVAQDLHDELGARLAEVGILGTLAENPDISREKQNGYLQRLAELGRLLVSGLDEIVWAVNPRHDTNTAVSGYLRDYAQDFLHSADIACFIEDVQPWPDGVFNAQERHQLFLAFREALTNVVKHAQASEVWVRIGGDDHSLCVMVEDNGTGIRPDASPGDGLINMRNRMNQIGGECEVKPRPEGGTSVTFRVFKPKDK